MRSAGKNTPRFQSGGIPELDGLVLAAPSQELAVRRPDQRVPLRHAGERLLQGRSSGIPKPHRFVLAATGQSLAIGRKCDRPDSIFMSVQGVEFAPRGEIPKFDRLIQACGGQHLPIRRKRRGNDRLGMRLNRRKKLIARCHFPKPHQAIKTSGRKNFPIGRQFQERERGLALIEGAIQDFASREIPKRDAFFEPIADRQLLAVGSDDHACSKFRSPKIDPAHSRQNEFFVSGGDVPKFHDELLGCRRNGFSIGQQRDKLPRFFERVKRPPSAGFAEVDRTIRRSVGELLTVGSKPAQRRDVGDREPFCPSGQVPNRQTIVSAAGGKRVAIRRELDRVENVGIPAQRIKIVAAATLP